MRKGKLSVDTLDVAAQLTNWLTPATSDMNGVRKLDGKRSGGLNTQATTLGGAVRQCDVKTEKSGPSQLNPLFSLWLMGYPTEWAHCAEQVTQLSRKSLRK